MSILASIKHIWDQGDDDYEDDVLDESDAPSHSASSKHSAGSYTSDKYSSEKYTSSSGGDGGSSRSRSLRSVPIPLRTREKNIYTLRPKNQDEAAIAADYLKSGAAVVMNLETVERPVAVRIIDFMSGVCYGLEGQGHAMKLGDCIFLFTPAEFEISSDELDYGENRDFFFKDVDGSSKLQAAAKTSAPVAAGSGAGSTPGTGSAAPTVLPSAAKPAVQSQSGGPQAGGNVTPSGYATADYAAPVSAKMSAPAPEAIASTPAVDDDLPPVPSAFAPSNTVSSAMPISKAQSPALPSSSVYGSGGKAHVLIGGKPAGTSSTPARSTQPSRVSPSRPPQQSAYQPSEHRSWER